jgi:O-methyltransferase involved in polyketide biosynthesis
LISEEKRVLAEQYFALDKQLNNPENTGSRSDKANTLTSFIRINNVIGRARYTEDTLWEAVRQGVKHYVILGAGGYLCI